MRRVKGGGARTFCSSPPTPKSPAAPLTCQLVGLQPALRVDAAEHEVVGEAAGSRAGPGGAAPAHPSGGGGSVWVPQRSRSPPRPCPRPQIPVPGGSQAAAGGHRAAPAPPSAEGGGRSGRTAPAGLLKPARPPPAAAARPRGELRGSGGGRGS